MVRCIIGKKGSGKTKQLADLVNAAVNSEKGYVVCIERSSKLTYDISHKARLVATEEYPIKGYDAFFGFVCGIASQDYDLTDLFIDNLYKNAVDEDAAAAAEFLDKLNDLAEKHNFSAVVTISRDASELPEGILKYVK
ncbi:MAG: hypothetical protein IJC53_06080 [Clostridia bacterium]|nr:hypothetical protein [Clostridia bacterium]